MSVNFTKRFKKEYAKAPEKIKNSIDKRIELFTVNPMFPILRNHALSGKYLGLRSIRVTGDWRALYSQQGENIDFEALGTHSELYKK